MNPEQVYQSALARYNQVPDQQIVEQLNDTILQVVTTEEVLFESTGTYVISSDPEEDNDDLIMLRYAAIKTTANLIIVISAGYRSPASRLAYFKKLFFIQL